MVVPVKEIIAIIIIRRATTIQIFVRCYRENGNGPVFGTQFAC